MKKILIGVFITLGLQILFTSAAIIYKGEKSYYTYYAFLSKFPNNFTKVYLDSAIKQSKLSESIKLLQRQKKLIYSNSNEIMVGDLLLNTYKVFTIVESENEKKIFLSWLKELKKFLKKGYDDYYLDYIYFKTAYEIEDFPTSNKIFKNLQKLNFSNPNIYKEPLKKLFYESNNFEINKLCEEYYNSNSIYLPFTSKFKQNNQKFREFGDKTKIYINNLSNKYFEKKLVHEKNNRILIDIDQDSLIDGDGINKIIFDVYLQKGVTFKLNSINFFQNGIKKDINFDYILTSKNGFFYNDGTYFGASNLNRDKIYIHFNKEVSNINLIELKIEISKLNPTSINCNG
jgi:hypothetical protein|tara:strand:- start:95 stop:1126 length:1032 start_codon:yes stop_codon:yes gene_type:complete